MSLLSDLEIKTIIQTTDAPKSQYMYYIARAIEAAVIAKLATVSVESVGYRSRLGSGSYTYCRTPEFFDNAAPLYTTEAIAAARVQENEKIANWYYNEGHKLAVFEVAPAIRALITDKGQ